MKISHIAIWTTDLETLRKFYITYFEGRSGKKYTNPRKGFESYFIYFGEEKNASLEIMQRADITRIHVPEEYMGITHIAFSTGSKEKVNLLTEQLRKDGFRIVGEPHTTGDGYYESVVLDPDGNRVEITD